MTIRRMFSILNQLEFGGTQVNLERFDIVSVIEGVINSIGIKAQQKGVNITFRHREPVSVWADEFQIEEVITNYLSNAINHVDAKKIINVEITEKNGIVRVSVFNSGKQERGLTVETELVCPLLRQLWTGMAWDAV